MSSREMTDYEKVSHSGDLRIASMLGFKVRGFVEFKNTRGGGSKLIALSIERDGQPVTDLYLGAGFHGYGVSYKDSDGVEHKELYSVQLSDEGELRVGPKGDAAKAAPAEPAWR